MQSSSAPWWRQLNRYHWFVFIVAAAAWFFDCLDQRLFSLARIPAIMALAAKGTPPAEISGLAKNVTALFLIGWGIGGLIFGSLGDRFGRARMLTITVLLYSGCTGLSFFSRTTWDFALFRFLTGVGVGGVFGLAVALIAESVPDGARTGALGMLQVLSTVGNISAGLFKAGIDSLEKLGHIQAGHGWRFMFLIGALPAVLVIFIQRYLKEPETWIRLKEAGHLPKGNFLSPYLSLLQDDRWRRNLFVGSVIASTGVVGLWAIGEYAVDLQRSVFRIYFERAGLAPAEVKAGIEHAIFYAYVCQMLGAAVGMWIFTRIAMKFGRRPAFAIGFATAFLVTVLAYWQMKSPQDAYWMMALMGGAQLAVFAGFAIYLPELFPSRLRSTGTSFCYNLGRFAAAAGSFSSSAIASTLYGRFGSPSMERYAAMTMCVIFLVGIAILPWAPETRDQPLPED